MVGVVTVTTKAIWKISRGYKSLGVINIEAKSKINFDNLRSL